MSVIRRLKEPIVKWSKNTIPINCSISVKNISTERRKNSGKSKKLMNKFKREGRKRTEEIFDWDIIAKQFEKSYKNQLNG